MDHGALGIAVGRDAIHSGANGMNGQMQFTIRFEKPAQWVRCTVTGTIRAPRLEAMGIEALAMGRAHGCHACLIDVTEAVAGDSLMETFQLMTHLDGLGLQRTDYVAVVYSTDAQSHTFAETVARNRGWTNVQYFTDCAAAEAWLRQMLATPVV